MQWLCSALESILKLNFDFFASPGTERDGMSPGTERNRMSEVYVLCSSCVLCLVDSSFVVVKAKRVSRVVLAKVVS